jgi:hypothetical protein
MLEGCSFGANPVLGAICDLGSSLWAEGGFLAPIPRTLRKIYVGVFTFESALPHRNILSLTTCSIQREMFWSFQS